MAKKKVIECGLIMPISSLDGCNEAHWVEVKSIITDSIESIEEFNIQVKLVSDADDIGVIQKRIVQNLYNSNIVVCDVSGKNPNVMFELGMRLAFDKATVIVKDDNTDYSFDTGIIEHITYPRDLRFPKIVAFKEKLTEKVIATFKKSEEDPDHSTFLKNFGKFQVANLQEDIVSSDKMMLDMLGDLRHDINLIRRQTQKSSFQPKSRPPLPPGKIAEALNAWILLNGECSTKTLVNNNDFYDFVEDRIAAGTYFMSRDQFESFLTFHLNTLED